MKPKHRMSKLKEQIQANMVAAMKAREREKLGTIRMLMAAIKQREIDEQITLNNEQILAVIGKMIKQRQDSIKQYQDAGRNELADKEQDEIDILQAYLPPPLSDAEIKALIKAAISQTGAESMKDMGKVMGSLKTKLQGRADMGQVSAKIKELLQ